MNGVEMVMVPVASLDALISEVKDLKNLVEKSQSGNTYMDMREKAMLLSKGGMLKSSQVATLLNKHKQTILAQFHKHLFEGVIRDEGGYVISVENFMKYYQQNY